MNIYLRIAAWFFGIVLAILLLAVGAAFALEATIKGRIVSAINEQLSVPVQVKGNINFSLIRHFPNASLSFNEVVIDDKLRKKEKLLKVREFSLLFSVMDLLQSKVNISKVFIENGSLNIFIDKNGRQNFDILKPSKPGTTNQISIAIKKASLNKVEVIYKNDQSKSALALRVKQVLLKGDFNEQRYNVEVEGNGKFRSFGVGGDFISLEKEFDLTSKVAVNKLLKRIDIQHTNINLAENEFTLTGSIKLNGPSTALDLKANCTGKEIAHLLQLLPASVTANLQGVKGTGNYKIYATVKGSIGANARPDVHVNASLAEGNIALAKWSKELTNVFTDIEYGIDKDGNDFLRLKKFSGKIDNEPFNCMLEMTHLKQPTFDFSANGTAHLDAFNDAFADSVVADLGGTVRFDDFKVHGRFNNGYDFKTAHFSGTGKLQLNEVECRINNVTYGNINGTIAYDGDVLDIKGLTLNFLSTDVKFSGTISNLLPYVSALDERKGMEGIALNADGELDIDNFHLSNILETYSRKNNPIAARKAPLDVRDIFRINGKLRAKIGKMTFRKMEFKNIDAELQMVPLQIQIDKLNMVAMGGSVTSVGYIDFPASRQLLLNLNIDARDVDVVQVFKQCENFGQKSLTDENLRGNLNLNAQFKTIWNNYSSLDQNNLSAIIGFELKNGELIDFEPIKAASKFIKVDELKRIRFADIKNQITIQNRMVLIPSFEIKTNAINLIFSGTHTFDNMVDYSFKINLNKLLANKFRSRASSVEYAERDPYDGVNIYLAMKGELSNPSIKFDKASSAAKMKEDFKNEKEVLKNIFKKGSQAPQNEDKKREERYYHIDEEPKYMEFEDENPK
jgi:hypothetical protein